MVVVIMESDYGSSDHGFPNSYYDVDIMIMVMM